MAPERDEGKEQSEAEPPDYQPVQREMRGPQGPQQPTSDPGHSVEDDNERNNSQMAVSGPTGPRTEPPVNDKSGEDDQRSDNPELASAEEGLDQRAPEPRWKFRPTTLAKGRNPGFFLVILALLCTGMAAQLPPNQESCSLSCARKGIVARIPERMHKMEICCADGCWATTPSESSINYELPAELLLGPYNCSAHCWPNSAIVAEVQIRCPAQNECQLIDCWLCAVQITNPQCNPRFAATLFGALITTFLIVLGCFWSVIRRLHIGLWVLWQIVAISVSGPIKLVNWATGRDIRHPSAVQIRAKAERGVHQVRHRLRKAAERIRTARKEQRRDWVAYKATIALIALGALGAPLGGSEPISFTTRTETCRRGSSGLTCTVDSATTLTLLPFGQEVPLLIKDGYGILLGTVTLRMKALSMVCLPKTEGWHRSYRIHTLAVKRPENGLMPAQLLCRSQIPNRDCRTGLHRPLSRTLFLCRFLRILGQWLWVAGPGLPFLSLGRAAGLSDGLRRIELSELGYADCLPNRVGGIGGKNHEWGTSAASRNPQDVGKHNSRSPDSFSSAGPCPLLTLFD